MVDILTFFQANFLITGEERPAVKYFIRKMPSSKSEKGKFDSEQSQDQKNNQHTKKNSKDNGQVTDMKSTSKEQGS